MPVLSYFLNKKKKHGLEIIAYKLCVYDHVN